MYYNNLDLKDSGICDGGGHYLNTSQHRSTRRQNRSTRSRFRNSINSSRMEVNGGRTKISVPSSLTFSTSSTSAPSSLTFSTSSTSSISSTSAQERQANQVCWTEYQNLHPLIDSQSVNQHRSKVHEVLVKTQSSSKSDNDLLQRFVEDILEDSGKDNNEFPVDILVWQYT